MRMPGYAIAVVSGNVVEKPRLGKTKNGRDYAFFNIAVNGGYFDKERQWHDQVTFVPVFTSLPNLVQRISKGLIDKGSAVLVQATPQARIGVRQDGSRGQIGITFVANTIRVGRERNTTDNTDAPKESGKAQSSIPTDSSTSPEPIDSPFGDLDDKALDDMLDGEGGDTALPF